MPFSARAVDYILCIFLSLGLVIGAGRDHQTLTSLEAFSKLERCARNCIAYDEYRCWKDGIGKVLLCDYNCDWTTGTAQDRRYCRTDYMSVATDYLSNFVKAACTIGDYKRDMKSTLDL